MVLPIVWILAACSDLTNRPSAIQEKDFDLHRQQKLEEFAR
jgi:hypothetical protein